MFEEVISDLPELFHRVFPVHLLKDLVVPGLNWDVNEGEDSRMVEEMGD